jgi:soluble lytic murein transglycosylase-like protein
MNDFRSTRQLRSNAGGHSSRAMLRVTLVISISAATLAAMPGWLKRVEISDPIPFTDQIATLSEPDSSALASGSALRANKESVAHQALADSLGKRYRVSKEALERFIHLAYSAGQMTKIDPLLILAVMAVESSFNPIAESVMGAKGLMQIIPEFHQDKLAGPLGREVNALDPETNILAGAKVLREYATRSGEDLVAALRLYGGTAQDPANPYPTKVLSERERLQQILRRASERREVRTSAAMPRS